MMMSGTLFFVWFLEYRTYETNKANKTYGTDGNDIMMEIIILTKIAFYVQIQIF